MVNAIWNKKEAVDILNDLDDMPDGKVIECYKKIKNDSSPFADLLNPEEAREIVERQALHDAGIIVENGLIVIGAPVL